MQAKALKLRENFYWAGILDDTLRVFDIIMYTEFGTTYNSYLYKAGDKVILFETVKEKFFDDYLKELEKLVDVTKIDYLVVNHTEPDHAGSVQRLLELNPGLKVIATPTAISFLQNIVNGDFCSIAVKDEQARIDKSCGYDRVDVAGSPKVWLYSSITTLKSRCGRYKGTGVSHT